MRTINSPWVCLQHLSSERGRFCNCLDGADITGYEYWGKSSHGYMLPTVNLELGLADTR